jgi:choice-of-anchor B domain-containing protein
MKKNLFFALVFLSVNSMFAQDLTITTEVCTDASEVRLTGPWWGWSIVGGPEASSNGDGTWTFTLPGVPENMEYLLVVDGFMENLIPGNTNTGDWSCTPITDSVNYANRQWVLGSGDVSNVYGTCGSCYYPIEYSDSLNMSLLSNLIYDSSTSQYVSDIWGYSNDSSEYALVGLYDGISIVDVTDPYSPNEVVFYPGPESNWRDLKTYGDYLYCVNETSGGLQIINLLEVISGDTNATYIENIYLGFTEAHNIYIDENGILYVFGSNYGAGGAIMFDLNSDPENPTILGDYSLSYFHDGMVRGDTLWGGAIYNGEFSVVDVSDKANPVLLATHSTPHAFTHNCWISDDGSTLFTTDEVSGAFVTAYDVSDINDIEELDLIQAWSSDTDVIPHNTHVNGDFLITSYYRDGLSVVDASNPSNLIEVAYFDSSPLYSGSGFNGAWGTYPFLPSGNILVSDRENGLLVLKPNYTNASFIEGYVTSSSNGAPISNVTVSISGSNNPSITALNGFYETGIANAGTYDIYVTASGYVSDTLNVTLSSEFITQLDIELAPSNCMNETACNYNPLATFEDGSCEFAEMYYDCIGECLNDIDGDGICDELEIEGCTDITAFNYNSSATDNDGSCIDVIEDCMNISAYNYEPNANIPCNNCCDNRLMLQGIMSLDIPGQSWVNSGAIHLVAKEDIININVFGINNGDNLLPISVSEGDDILIVRSPETIESYFGSCYNNFDHIIEASIMLSGDDDIQLYENGELIEVFGELNVDGTGEYWDYEDSWAYKVDGEWTYAGPFCDSYSTSMALSDCIYPICDFQDILGCTNGIASNYNENATIDDGSCIIYGCTSSTDPNYNSQATEDDGSCEFVYGCTDSVACNYNVDATNDNGSCLFSEIYYDCDGSCINDSDSDGICDELEIQGCTNISALNFDINATEDDGSCILITYGCTDSSACNYNTDASTDNGTCIYAELFYNCEAECLNDSDGDTICDELEISGCTDTIASNFNPIATDDDGNCIYIIYGCTNENACNYNIDATNDDGSCIFSEIYYDCDSNCINDQDFDQICDEIDNCKEDSNPGQEDIDNDGEGDACDYDDGIGIDEISENTPTLIKMIDVLGREQQEHNKGSLLFYIYDNGKIEKKVIH